MTKLFSSSEMLKYEFSVNKPCSPYRKKLILGAILTTLGAGCGTALAEESTSKGASDRLEEVIVTAMRREEGLQSVPIAITAISGSAMDDAGVFNSVDLTNVVPNLTFTPTGFSFHPTIRGVGTRNVTQGDEANVSMYIDGVYQPDMTSTAFDFVDIERVEVLRGPQGTLFGRNSTGGLINVITAKPSHELSGKVALRYGSYNERSLKAYVTGPLSEKVAVGLAISTQAEDGYIDDLLRGGKFGEKELNAVRGKLLFEPSDDTEIVLSARYSSQEDLAQLARQPLNGNTSTVLIDPNVIVPTGKRQVAMDADAINEREDLSADLQMSFAFSAFDFKSTTSIQDYEFRSLIDSDGSPLSLVTFDINGTTDSFTQEFRVMSNESSSWNWIAGVFALKSTGKYVPLKINTTVLDVKNVTESVAAFAEGTLPLGENLSVTAGVRYTDEERTFNFTANGNHIVKDATTSFGEWTPRVVVEYGLGDSGMAYASYSRGFKSGVFNTTSSSPIPVDPEILDAFEIGVKLDPLDNLRTNFSLFSYDYDNIQLSAQDQTTNVVRLLNAASASILGFEAEATWRASDNLDLSLFGTFLDAEYDDFPGATVNRPVPGGAGNAQFQVDASGSSMIRAPEYTFSVRGDYHQTLSRGSVAGITGSVYYSDEYYWDFEERLVAPSYTMVSGEAYWHPQNDKYRVSLWVHNLLDEDVVTQILTGKISDSLQYSKPRTAGIAFQASF